MNSAIETRHYLDNAATTRVDPQVVEAMLSVMADSYANPAALHRAGVEALHRVEQARREVALLIGADADELIFTSGGTESNNLALRGVLEAYGRHGGHLITSVVEHASILATAQALEERGYAVTRLAVDPTGRVDPEALRAAVRPDTLLISLALVNNELGTVQPLSAWVEAIQEARRATGAHAWLHIDAVQAVGKVPFDVHRSGVDLATVSAHKIHGPKGVGALYIRRGVRVSPIMTGGEQERGIRPGTHNVPGIVGFGEAARLTRERWTDAAAAMGALKRRFLDDLAARVPEAVVNGPRPEDAAPHIVNISVPGMRGEFLVHGLAERGVYVSTGSACTSRRAEASHVLKAIGVPPASLESALRVSLSAETTEADLTALVEGIAALRQEMTGIIRTEAARRRTPSRPPRLEIPAGSERARPVAEEEIVILVRFGEIGLKGQNRGYFERLLQTRVAERLVGTGAEVERSGGRLWVRPHGAPEHVVHRLQQVFGIVALSVAERVPLSVPALEEAVLRAVEQAPGTPHSFKVDAHRPNKAFPLTSLELNRVLGRAVKTRWPGLAVDVHRPDLTVRVEVRDDAGYVWRGNHPGPGGLPVGAGGRAVALLSGGFDSPVAAWMAMKRGMKTSLVYFHSYPFTSDLARDKVTRLAEVLAGWGGPLRLHVVYFTDIQRTIQQACPPRLTITVMRRMMLRLAERIARRERALLLVTGESLGQVASQTPESLQTIGAVARLPVLRPVIGMDKTEIIERAEAIGTAPISALPFEDCCAVFQPAHPATRPTIAAAEAAEAVRDWEPLLAEALARTETLRIAPA
jgi:tRNA sulfurtransferase ThiI